MKERKVFSVQGFWSETWVQISTALSLSLDKSHQIFAVSLKFAVVYKGRTKQVLPY